MKSASSRLEKPQNVKRKSTSTKSKIDRVRLESKHTEAKPNADHPEASLKPIVHRIGRRGLEPLPASLQFRFGSIAMSLSGSRYRLMVTRPKSIPFCERSGLHRSNPTFESFASPAGGAASGAPLNSNVTALSRRSSHGKLL